MQTPSQALLRPSRRAGIAAALARSLRRPAVARGAAGRTQLGMTLIEIMVVVAIISLIMGGVGIMAFNRYQDAQKTDAKNQTITIQGAVEQYRTAKRGKCPKTMQDLKAAGFISRVAKDPWGNDYEFKCPGEKTSIDVMSPGEDGEFGTPDDITNYGEEGEEGGEEG